MRKYDLKLNLNKCIFGATSSKLLGFIVSRRGIEIDPAKIKAITEIPAPRTKKKVRGFLGRLNYIGPFHCQTARHMRASIHVTPKERANGLDTGCQEAFEKIMAYLFSPLVLVPPVPGRPLMMYLVIHDTSMAWVLGQHDDSGKKEQANLLPKQKIH